jgi:hypothetical protein
VNGTHQLLVYSNDDNLLGRNINTINKNTEALLDTSNYTGLEGNTEKTIHLFMSQHMKLINP